jgi:hypothetical protein
MATTSINPETEAARTYGVWITCNQVLDIGLNRHSKGFPPDAKQVAALNGMIQGLARAILAVKYHADNDTESDEEFLMQPVEDIGNVIVLLSMMADAIQKELHADEPRASATPC